MKLAPALVALLALLTTATGHAESPRSIAALAADALVAGQYDAAAQLAAEAARGEPDDARTYLVLGLALDQLGRHADAAEAYCVHVRLAADRYRGLRLLGRALVRAGDVARAVEVYGAAHALRTPAVQTAAVD
jgi:tetratricopeptide (TPR) repeat protein